MVVNIDWLQLSLYKIGEKPNQKEREPLTMATYCGDVILYFNSVGCDFPRLHCVDTDKELVKDVFIQYDETGVGSLYIGQLIVQRQNINECGLKIANELLYYYNLANDTNLYRQIQLAVENSKWEFKHITRCDICVDFDPVKDKICGVYEQPPEFIADLVASKIKRCSNGAARATMSTNKLENRKSEGNKVKIVKSGGNFSYIRFSNYLPTSVLYNKSAEFRTKAMKTYIRSMWQDNGMDDSLRDIWRYEARFNFKGSSYSEIFCKALHDVFMSSPTPLNFIMSTLNDYILQRVRFLGVDKMRKVPLFDFPKANVTNCNLTEYKLSEKLPNVSSYHIGICKFLRGFLRDVQDGKIQCSVPVDSIAETADFILSQINDLVLSRGAHSCAKSVKYGFYSPKSNSMNDFYNALDIEQQRIYLEINVLHSEIQTARALKTKCNKVLEEKLNDLISLRQFLKENCAVSPVK